jgi:hypothetical protein
MILAGRKRSHYLKFFGVQASSDNVNFLRWLWRTSLLYSLLKICWCPLKGKRNDV